MKPDIDVEWRKALGEYEKAKRHVTAGEHDAAKVAAVKCVRLAALAVMEFSRESSGKTLHLVTAPAYEAVHFNWEKHCSRSCDYLREARRLLTTLRNSLPPENDLPLPTEDTPKSPNR